ncbi:MAG: DNA polymerase III subunit alpha [Treponema sp.]|jgi:DNA polymerase-3 subunit alpha|nr:DNA polymerase III subunit alpha [Treponema sp.]
MTDFVHLHVHSDYSLLDAAVSVMSLANRVEELGMEYLALTDHGNMFGAMAFLAACRENVKHEDRKNPVKPIIGCEVYVSPGSRFEKKGSENENKYYHLVLLAASHQGYFNLVKLCSFAYTEGFYYRPRIDEDLLKQYHGGLIALSACVSGEIPRLIRAGKSEEAEQKARHYRELFGEDTQGNPCFYLEIQDHGITAEQLRGDLSQRDINKEIVNISRKTGIPLVATNDVHYLDHEDFIAHDVMLCIGTGKLRREEKRKKYQSDQFYFKTGDEMAALFPEYPEAIANTVRIAQRCTAEFLKPNKKTGKIEYRFPSVSTAELPRYLPECTIPPEYAGADSYLRHLAIDGIARRYPLEKAAADSRWDEIQKRTEYELNTIITMGFTGYFLIVADFINWAQGKNIPVGPGRGSGAGSIVAYALRITDIDPLKYNLLFERFLNPERISMPDFDVDFANEGREEVIKYITNKYGAGHVGQIITFGTLGAKAVIKDVARVLEISIPESNMITKLIPKNPKITLQKAIKGEPKLQEFEKNSRYEELFKLAKKLEGLNRHSSLHAAGVVIGKSVLHNFVPLYRDPKTGGIATQYDMNHLEPCGLVKMDCLGLKTLDVIKHTSELVRQRGGEYKNFDIKNVSETDEATFKMLGEGKSFEVFQFESEGMQSILRQAKPGKIEDLIALNALFRPGPMDNIPQFVASKHGRQAIRYPDPSLEEVLKETYGVIVYQEQVMQVARIIAGYSMGKADQLRRAMGKKKPEIIAKEKGPFIEGAKKQGFSESDAGRIYDILAPFAGYGFNKSHAAAYSVLAYHTAYLKANFPAEFMAANLTNEIHSADKNKLSKCVDEARKMGIAVDPPDVNRSDKLFTVVDGHIVFGFLGIKGIGDAPAEEIVRCRQNGPYQNFMDFLERVDIRVTGKKTIELLIKTGAFDCFAVSRETLEGNLERAVEYAQKKKEDRQHGQTSLFEETSEAEYRDYVFEAFPPVGRMERLNIEKQFIGFYFSGHPMDEYKEIWQKAVKVDLGKPETIMDGNGLLVGLIKNIKNHTTAKGDKMCFASLADYNGEIEITFFARVWEKCQNYIEAGTVAILQGKFEYQQDKDRRSFIVNNWVSPEEIDTAIKEEEVNARKWEKLRGVWLYMADLKSRRIASTEKGSYTIIGLLKSLREIKDKNGNDMAFGTLQDCEGEIDLIFFSKVWNECRDILRLDEFTALKGTLDPANARNPQKPGFRVSSIADFASLSRSASRKAAAGETPEVPETATAGQSGAEVKSADTISANASDSGDRSPRTIHIKLRRDAVERDESLYPLRDVLEENPGPAPVFIHVTCNGAEKVIRTVTGIAASEDAVFNRLKDCGPVDEIWRE